MKVSKYSIFVFVLVLFYSGCSEEAEPTEVSEGFSQERGSDNARANSLVSGAAHPYYFYFKGVTNNYVHASWSDNKTTWSPVAYIEGPSGSPRGGVSRLSTLVTPAVITLNNQIVVVGTYSVPAAFGNPGFSDRLYMVYLSDGVSLVGSARIDIKNYSTKKSPSIINFLNKEYVFYISTSSNQEILYTYNGVPVGGWSNQIALSYQGNILSSLDGVSTLVHNNKLYVFYVNRTNFRIQFVTTTDGITWSAPTNVCDNSAQCSQYYVSTSGVSALVHNNAIFVIYKGGGGQLYVSKQDSPCLGCWSKNPINGSTATKPNAISDGTNILLMFRGETNNYVHTSYSQNGFNWYNGNRAGGETTGSIGVVYAR